MKKLILLAGLLFLLAGKCSAQTQIQSGPTNPPTCNPAVGQVFFNNSTSPGIMYICTALNTWSPPGGGFITTGTPGQPAVYLTPTTIGSSSTLVYYANAGGFAGSDAFAKINSALATFPAGFCGTVIADFTTNQTTSTPLTIPPGCSVDFSNVGTYTVSTPQYTVAASGASPKGAVENAGATLATICTTAPNNYVANQMVNVSGVTDTTFNGEFPIASITSSSCFVVPNIVPAANAFSGSGLAQQPAITVNEGATLQGAGANDGSAIYTAFKASASFAASVVVGETHNLGANSNYNWDNGTLNNFEIIGNNSAMGGSGTVGNCLSMQGYGEAMHVSQIVVKGCGQNGISLYGNANGTGTMDGLAAFKNVNGCGFNLAIYGNINIGQIAGDTNFTGLCIAPLIGQGYALINIAQYGTGSGPSGDRPNITIDEGTTNVSGSITVLHIGSALINSNPAVTNFIKANYHSGSSYAPQIRVDEIYGGGFTNIFADDASTVWPFAAFMQTGYTAMMGWELPGIGSAKTFSYLDVYQGTRAVSNGLNSNVVLGSDHYATAGWLKLTGPTGAFSIGGFFNNGGEGGGGTAQPGRMLAIENTTAQPMVIVNEDASSTAANRIKTGTGSSVNCPSIGPYQTAEFIYSGADSRWILIGGSCITGAITTNLLISQTAPTITTHFNTSSDSISANNGTAAFTVTVGTGAGTTTGVLGLPTATTGWNCFASNMNRAAIILQSASTTASATLTNYAQTAGVTATNWTNSDVLHVSCFAY